MAGKEKDMELDAKAVVQFKEVLDDPETEGLREHFVHIINKRMTPDEILDLLYAAMIGLEAADRGGPLYGHLAARAAQGYVKAELAAKDIKIP